MRDLSIKLYVKIQSILSNERGSQSLEWVALALTVIVLTSVIATAIHDGKGEQNVGDAVVNKFVDLIKKVGSKDGASGD